jgi:hypothetical protein
MERWAPRFDSFSTMASERLLKKSGRRNQRQRLGMRKRKRKRERERERIRLNRWLSPFSSRTTVTRRVMASGNATAAAERLP